MYECVLGVAFVRQRKHGQSVLYASDRSAIEVNPVHRDTASFHYKQLQ